MANLVKGDDPDLARDFKVSYRDEELPEPTLLTLELHLSDVDVLPSKAFATGSKAVISSVTVLCSYTSIAGLF